jgi:translocation and assembly module TamB
MDSDATPDPASPLPPPPRVPRRSRRTRIATVVLLAPVLLCALALAVLAWLLGTESGARNAFALSERIVPGMLQASDVAGRLSGKLHVGRLVIHTASADITLQALDIDWTPTSLWQGQLQINRLTLADLVVHNKPQPTREPLRLSASLNLPLAVHVARAELVHAAVENDAGRLVDLDRVQFRLDFERRQYRLQLDNLGLRAGQAALPVEGDVKGKVALSATLPYAIDAELAVRADTSARQTHVAANGKVVLGGSLQDLASSLDFNILQPAPAPATAMAPPSSAAPTMLQLSGKARLQPFSASAATPAALPLSNADLTLRGLDLAAWKPGLPHTGLDASLKIDGTGNGALHVANAASGTWDAARLPLRDLTLRFQQRQVGPGQTLDLRDIVAELGSAAHPAGKLAGSGRYADGDFALQVQTSALDLKRLDARLRATRLAGKADLRSKADEQEITVALTEPLNGPNRAQGLSLDAHALLNMQRILLDRALLRAGPASIDASGQADLQGKQAFSAHGRLQRFRLKDIGNFPGLPELEINGEFAAHGSRAPGLEVDLSYRIADSRLAGQPLAGNGEVHLHGDTVDIPRLQLTAGANALSAHGRLAGAEGSLEFTLHAPQLAQLGPWVSGALEASGSARGNLKRADVRVAWQATGLRIPGANATSRVAAATSTGGTTSAAPPPAPRGGALIEASDGKASLSLERGTPLLVSSADIEASVHQLAFGAQRVGMLTTRARFGARADAPLSIDLQAFGVDAPNLRAERVTLQVNGSNARHAIAATLHAAKQDWSLRAQGGLSDLTRMPQWKGAIEQLDGGGELRAHLLASAPLSVTKQHFQLRSFRLDSSVAQVAVEELTRDGDQVVTRGRIDHLLLAQALRLASLEPAIATDLALRADWDLRIADTVSGKANVRREQGDVTVQGGRPVALGLATLEAGLVASDGRATLRLHAAGKQLGRIDLDAATALGHGAARFAIAPDAPLSGTASIDMPSLAWAGPLVSPTTITEGRIRGDANLAGSVGDPRLSGQVSGSDLRFFLADSGIDLRRGSLQGAFNGARLTIESLRFAGGDGQVVLSGPIDFAGGKPALQLALKADRYTLFNRTDRKLVLSGASQIALVEKRASVTGAFKIDSATIDIGREDAPQLSDDVVIVGQQKKSGGAFAAALDVTIALGDGITLKGRGLDAVLRGEIRLRNGAGEPLQAQGTLNVAKGTFSAYGRDLKVEQGLVRFTGPLNNPGLDILAMRRGLQVEAGVSVRGTVLAPRITLVSEPTVADADKLAWLVLGHGLSDTGQGEVGTLQSAASALLQKGAAAGVQSQLATALGLDTVSVGTSQDTLQQRIVTLGKQVSSRLYVSYQKGLDTASNAVLLRYTLTPRLTVEAEAGTISVLSLFYNVLFD